ncbi:MAG TPA: hypothetical protein ENN74_00460, partial [Firmicutes bacterium]|nr:hypothetical protein [Bacillota bacterium]
MRGESLPAQQAFERLSETAARLSACRDRESIAQELLRAAGELFGVKSGAMYIPPNTPEGLWERVGSSGESAPATMALPEETLRELSDCALQPDCAERLLASVVSPSTGQSLVEPLEPFHGGMVVPVTAAERLEAILLLGPPAESSGREGEWRGGLTALAQQGAMALYSVRLASELQDLREELDRKVLQLLTLFEVGREIHSFAHWELLTKNILYTAMGNLGIREGALLAPQRPGEPFRIWHSRGMPMGSLAEDFHLPALDPLVKHLGKVRRALERRVVEQSFPHNRILKLAFEVLLPGISSHGVEFVLLLGRKLSGKPLGPDELEYLMILCGQAAVVFENQELVRRSIERERLAAVGQALAGLSHDFRGILQGFDGASRHLGKLLERVREGRSIDAAKLDKWWGLLCSSERRLTDLVQDILEYSKPREPVREACSINALIEELVRQRKEELARRRIRLELDLAPSLPPVEADTTRLYRVLANLFDNACDAVSAGTGRIEVRTRMQPDAVTVEVKDNGVGIAPEN